MDNLGKFLYSARKLEGLQTARKAKEVDEIRKFDVQLEARKRRNLAQTLETEQQHTQALNQKLAEPLAAEQAWRDAKTDELRHTEAFAHQGRVPLRQAQDIALRQTQGTPRFDEPMCDFDIIEEIQGFGFRREPYSLKQLPAADIDAFTHELSDQTDSHLSQEVHRNQQAVTPEPEPEPEPQPDPEPEAKSEPKLVQEETPPSGIYFRTSPLFHNFPK
jgi:hypothetical protein